MTVRRLAVALLLCLASPFAHATFSAPLKWVHLGTFASNPCLAEYPGGPCKLFDSALEAGLGNPGPWTFCGSASYASGSFPNEIWSVGPFRVNGNCTGTAWDNYVKQVALSCPANSSLSGSNCTCDTGYHEVVDGAGRMSCQVDEDKNTPCPGGCRTFPVGNPINPATGNKFQRQEIYASGQGLDFSIIYNSAEQDRASFGYRWRGFYDRRIKIVNSNAVAYRPDGKKLAFAASGGSWIADADVDDELTELSSGGVTTGWVLKVAEGDLTENYNAAGKLTSIVMRDGRTFTVVHSDGTTGGASGSVYLNANGTNSGTALPAGMLIKVLDHTGRTLSFWYYVSLNVGRVSRPGGGDYKFAYDNSQRLTSITWPDTRVRTFVYNESAHTGGANLPYALTGIVDENSDRYATFKYDSQGRATSTQHAGGADEYTITYNVDGSADVTDALGASRNYTFQTVLDVKKSTGMTGALCPSCGPKAQSFDSNGNVATRTDWNGNRTDYTYDSARNLETSRTEALTSTGSTTPQTRTITTEWHSSFRLPTRVAEPLRLTTYVYNGDSGASCGFKADGTTLVPGVVCTKTVQATTDTNGSQGFSATTTGNPRTWTYTYNVNGKVLAVNGPRTDVTDTTTYTYHADNATCAGISPSGCRGLVATATNAAGHVTQITQYASNGQPILIVDPNGLNITLGYDARHRLTSRNVGGETTTYTYDFAGLLTRVTLPDSSYLNYTYDDAHRITAMQDNLGNRIAYTLDDMGNRTVEEVRDPSNNLMQTRSRVYSSLNRLFQEIGAASQTTEYTYDDQGNVLTVNGPLSGTVDVTTNQYDALNRLKQVTDPSSGVTQYGYNGQDALTSVTDPRSLATSYTVDGLGNLTQQVSPDTGTTGNTYDAAGNLLTQTDAKSQVTTYTYDALNRVTQILFHDGSKQVYGYDAGTYGKGHLTSIEERNPSNTLTGSHSYVFDQKGRVTSNVRVIAGVSYTTGYRYDTYGRLDRVTYPSGRTVDYTFDSLGRVSGVTSTPSGGSAQTIASSITYQPFGGLKGLTFGNSQTYTRGYDQDGRVNSYTLAGVSYAVLYDAASRIETITETLNPPNTNTYGYDVLDRLTSATLPATTYGYTYDDVGNRLTKTTGANTDTYTYGSTSNRIATLTPSSGPARSFTLDSNGSTTDDDVNTYTYDVRGRMVSATSSAGTTDYYVNALGQRERKTTSGADGVFHYDLQGHLMAESTAAGTTTKEYIWLGDTPIAVIVSGNRHYVHTDHLNTPRLVSNGTPATVWRWDQMEPFGVNAADENPSGLGAFEFALRFPGQYFDKETNLHYNYFRDYDSGMGRYVQSDPIGLHGGLNTYAYVAAEPTRKSDPRGLYGLPWELPPGAPVVCGFDPSLCISPHNETRCFVRCSVITVGLGLPFEMGVEHAANRIAEDLARASCKVILKGFFLVENVRGLNKCYRICYECGGRSCPAPEGPWNNPGNSDFPRIPPLAQPVPGSPL